MDAIRHELGHGFISFLYHGEYYSFEGITMDPKKLLNPNDIAYTISLPVENLDERVQGNQHRAASCDGLFLLAGAAGQTFLLPDYNGDEEYITLDNINETIDWEGTSGDLEAIARGGRPYGWYLNASNFTGEQRQLRNVRIMIILKKIFRQEEVLLRLEALRGRLVEKKGLVIEDFAEFFDEQLVCRIKDEIETYIKEGVPGLLLLRP